ncbi:MAG: carbohydrate ABC transporter permease [Spirochaetaceae bacterium]|jgi:multiple sugar transport system permease protein|nr:carbohydrate ABC transporter permease [Spirochaetaceae bacterium]
MMTRSKPGGIGRAIKISGSRLKQAHSPGSAALTGISLVIAVIFLFPLVFGLFASLKVESASFKRVLDWFQPPYTLANYVNIFTNSRVPMWTFNSFFIAITGTVLGLIFSSLAAYPLAKMEFRGKRGVYFYFLMGLMVPGEATIVPLFITVNGLYMIDTYAGMILPGIAGSMGLIIMVSFFRSIPKELIEAANIDGASHFTIFSRIVIPLSRTVLVTTCILSFIGGWNNYLWPLLCAMSERMFTLPVGLPTFENLYVADRVITITGNMAASIPAIIVFLIFERQITQGIALSGIKE